MSFGKPVISTNISSLPEVVGEAGLLVEVGSREALTRAIYDLATDETLYTNLVNAARQRSIAFNWLNTASASLAVLAQVGEQTKPPMS